MKAVSYGTCLSDTHEPAIQTSTSCQLDTHPPACPTGTIIKRENEKNTYIQTGRAYVCISQTSDAEAKADSFIEQAKSLQSNRPELGIIIKTTVRNKLIDLFNAQLDLSVKDLGGEWISALEQALNCRAIISKDD